ncbi:peptidoglycan glycosyltransferase/peptidoglycan DD-transpeptidase MrcA [Candidatus Hoaglandella endobia]|uniref:Penicillin-binding protein 1A n=1 Tax=Candidatus Hoaglandella endobia TaxID=1778263 RepID=A0A143WUG5_9ENTR|nr:peptidoglycan glycosyltransferase/peptidoglycan DD-transpeptidase MrcA [Candidatus Hoaglandella endobia]CUX97226.1 Penicillin-binding protein 1A [Candidatus Hoaglandella endobia]
MKLVKYLFIFAMCCIVLAATLIFGMYYYLRPQLPDVAALKDIRLQTPMQVFSADAKLIAQYGEKRRIPLRLDQIPHELVLAFVATEDNRFYEHHGLDPVGILRAASIAFLSGHASQGASTITQQLARNFFLSPERTIIRKIKEAILAVRIEQMLSKDEILKLYLNKIYMGYRAYGVGAAAQVYFGKEVSKLTLSEMAMIAGLPKAPSTFNPLYSPERALARRNTVLAQMRDRNYITQSAYQKAHESALIVHYHLPEIDFSAPYVSEMVRQDMLKRYGDNAYTKGLKVYTTINKTLQQAAQTVVRNNVLAYDRRHGYHGPHKILWKVDETPWDAQRICTILKTLPVYGPLHAAVITEVDTEGAVAMMVDGSSVFLDMAGIRWARKFKSDTQQGQTPKKATDVIQVGQQVWIRQVNDGCWWLSQVPDVNAALVSLDPHDGAIKALVGGFDFNQSKFNRVTQALRQVGSNIKPFLYTAALDKGLTLATILNDAPISRWDAGSSSAWRPRNSPPTYLGPIRLRQGLGQSKNVVMVRAMRAMGVDYAAQYLQRFGFPVQNIVHTESLALGSASFTPMQLVRGYAVLANGGYLVDPYLITKVTDEKDHILFEAKPKVVGNNYDFPVIYSSVQKSAIFSDNSMEKMIVSHQLNSSTVPRLERISLAADAQLYAPHVISTPLSFLMRDALNSNIFGEPGWLGTGWRAAYDLKRHDIGGKTSTTNDSKDAWFSGYGPGTVTTVWIGFDDHRRNLGRTTAYDTIDQIAGIESGAKSAQPIWDDYMKIALEGVPEEKQEPPLGIVTVIIDKNSGKLSIENDNSRQEYFIAGTQPKEWILHEIKMTVMDNGNQKELF